MAYIFRHWIKIMLPMIRHFYNKEDFGIFAKIY